MRHWTPAVLALGLLLLSAVHGSASTTILSEADGRLVVEVAFDGTGERLNTPGLPALEYERFFVAVPDGATVVARAIDGNWEEKPGVPQPTVAEPGMRDLPLPAAWRDVAFPGSPCRVGPTFAFRGTQVVPVDCFRQRVDYVRGKTASATGYTVVVEYPSPGRAARIVDPFVAEIVANRTIQAAEPVRASGVAAPDPHFSLSPNWVRITIEETGVYSITGSDLSGIGVSLGSILNPSSFRLFTGGGLALDRDLTALSPQTWEPGAWMRECDIQVEYGSDGSFDPTDRIVFYAVGLGDYADLYGSGQPRDTRTDHIYARDNVYFLTWDGTGFPGNPGRMVNVPAVPSGGSDIVTFEERLYLERDLVRDFNVGGDGWLWRVIGSRLGPEKLDFPAFTVMDLDVSRPQTFRTVALARYSDSASNNHHAEYLLNGEEVGDAVWTTSAVDRYEDALPVEVSGMNLVQEGANIFSLRVPRDQNPIDFMLFAFYEIRYHRFLSAFQDRLFFSSPPDTSGSINYAMSGFSTAGSMVVLDVTDQFRPQALTGFQENVVSPSQRDVRFSSTNNGGQQYFCASLVSSLRRPAQMVRQQPRDLRNTTTAPHMLIVTHPSFVGAASTLRQYRVTHLPMVSSPSVEVVTTNDIYDNFSGGVADPTAIRNYCKFLYDNFREPGGAPRLSYLLLLGDANDDYKNISTSDINFVPTNLNLTPASLDAYVTDEYFGLMDPEDYQYVGHKFLDIALGRLPAASVAEANFIVKRVIDYETQDDFGHWRDRVLLVADDENSPVGGNRQADFVLQSELIAVNYMSSYLDAVKVYLTEFPSIQGFKPASRMFLIEEWNKGALIFNYVGHGSTKQMADEQVFLDADVPNLRNGRRLPIVMALSCTLGRFAAAPEKSLAEKLLFRDGGGAIATLAATELTFISTNRVLNFNTFEELTPREPGVAKPIGLAIMAAKFASLDATVVIGPDGNPRGNETVEENNQKYNLLGDPAQRLLSPRQEIRFDAATADSLVAGKRARVKGAVYANGEIDRSFSGTVMLQAREPDDPSGYRREDGFTIGYRYPGGTMYQGFTEVSGGEFEFTFRVPRSAQTGPLGYFLAYADNSAIDAVARKDDVVLRFPTAGDSTALRPVDGAPRVRMGFQGGARKIKPGAILEAKVSDGDGVNILSTTPEGKLSLVFDRSNLPIDVTEFFEFDFGGADTSGVLRFPLPDIPVGRHEAALKVSDTFGQTRLDTLTFTLTDPLDYSAQVVLNYPNPFATSTQFLFRLTGRARIRLDLFTLSGKRIRRIEQVADPGEAWVFWDGRDSVGDAIANGTYLYVARVEFMDVDRPETKLRGKVVKIE